MDTMATIKPEELVKRATMEWSRDENGEFRIITRKPDGTPVAVTLGEESVALGAIYDRLSTVQELERSDTAALVKVLAGRDANGGNPSALGGSIRLPELNATVTIENYDGQTYRVATDGLGNIYAIPLNMFTRWTLGT